ncbi:MAG: bifunctional riboflavin kinase/FAD synthetase [Actinomycetes bacterium]
MSSALGPVRRFDGLSDVPSDLPRSVVAIGVFDGVHVGHRAILEHARRHSLALGGLPVVVVTFDPHPSEVVRPGSSPRQLATVEHRVALLGEAGADAVLVLPFTPELAALSPEDFVEQVLKNRLHAAAVVVGADFRFGHRAAGTVATLVGLGERLGFTVEGVTLVAGPDGAATAASSSYVRQCVLEGDVHEAALVLGRPHRVEGVVVHGDHRGRDLGYPTANLGHDERAAVPADGVYAGWLVDRPWTDPVRYPAAISIGTNPTFAGRTRQVEAYALDRDDLDLYGHPVAFDFAHRLRATETFDSVDALLVQMAQDVVRARAILSTPADPAGAAGADSA